jgi:hypothetical protein
MLLWVFESSFPILVYEERVSRIVGTFSHKIKILVSHCCDRKLCRGLVKVGFSVRSLSMRSVETTLK